MDGSSKSSKIVPEEERPTNTGSGSNEEDDENAGWVDSCAVASMPHSGGIIDFHYSRRSNCILKQ